MKNIAHCGFHRVASSVERKTRIPFGPGESVLDVKRALTNLIPTKTRRRLEFSEMLLVDEDGEIQNNPPGWIDVVEEPENDLVEDAWTCETFLHTTSQWYDLLEVPDDDDDDNNFRKRDNNTLSAKQVCFREWFLNLPIDLGSNDDHAERNRVAPPLRAPKIESALNKEREDLFRTESRIRDNRASILECDGAMIRQVAVGWGPDEATEETYQFLLECTRNHRINEELVVDLVDFQVVVDPFDVELEAFKKSLGKLEKLVMRLFRAYDVRMSHPDPNETLDQFIEAVRELKDVYLQTSAFSNRMRVLCSNATKHNDKLDSAKRARMEEVRCAEIYCSQIRDRIRVLEEELEIAELHDAEIAVRDDVRHPLRDLWVGVAQRYFALWLNDRSFLTFEFVGEVDAHLVWLAKIIIPQAGDIPEDVSVANSVVRGLISTCYGEILRIGSESRLSSSAKHIADAHLIQKIVDGRVFVEDVLARFPGSIVARSAKVFEDLFSQIAVDQRIPDLCSEVELMRMLA